MCRERDILTGTRSAGVGRVGGGGGERGVGFRLHYSFCYLSVGFDYILIL